MTRSLSKLVRDCWEKRRINRNRLVTKDGHCNIEYGHVRYSSRFAYLLDLWTTTLELRWSVVIFLFTASFLFSWFFFSLMWCWIAYSNGDLWWQYPSADHQPCVINVYGLTSAFLYSLTTQMTIGYGVRVITPFCADAIILLIIQTVIGTIIKAFWGAIIISKFSLPKKRAKTIHFSEMAVISPKNGALCLQLRVANLRKSLMVGSQIYGKLLRTTITPEGETIVMDQIRIDFLVDAGKDNLFFACPLTLYHVIDNTSPFCDMTVDTLQQQDFELIVFLDAMDESTNFFCQVRTSYLPGEIMWGFDFFPIITRSKEGAYCVDFSEFARAIPAQTPHCAYCYNNSAAHNYSTGDQESNGGQTSLDYQNVHKNL